jgi:hypothetical protein
MLILPITLEKSVILNPFVKTSAICSLVPTKGIHTIPSSSLSLMKCRSISTCLVLSCCTGLFAMLIAALLSQYNMMGLSKVIVLLGLEEKKCCLQLSVCDCDGCLDRIKGQRPKALVLRFCQPKPLN